MSTQIKSPRYHLAQLGIIAILWCSLPLYGQTGGKEITAYDATKIRAAIGVDLATLPATPAQKTAVMSGKQKHYIVFDGDRWSNPAAGSDQYWNGTVLIPSPEKTARLIQVSVKEATWSYSGWWYKNQDGSIALILKDPAGFKVGVVTIAGDGSTRGVIDLDYDGVAESVEQVLPGGRTVLLTDQEGLRMQQLWLTGHNPFCTVGSSTPKTEGIGAPGIRVPEDRATFSLCQRGGTTPGFSTESPVTLGSAAKRGPNTIEQMCAGSKGRPGIPGDFARDDFGVTKELVHIVMEGTDHRPDDAVTQAARAIGLSYMIALSALTEFAIHDIKTAGGTMPPTHHDPPPGPRPGHWMPADPSPDECRARDDQGRTWAERIAGAQAVMEKECPNPASQPVPAAARDKAEPQNVSVYCSNAQRQDARDRAETGSIFGSSSSGCGISERPGRDGVCRQKAFRGSSGHLIVGYGETLIFQVCPERTCRAPER